MATFTPRLPKRRTVFQALSISVVVILVAIALLTLYVYKQSTGKFEIRRLSLPTRVYADFTPLHAGMILPRDDLLEKLDRLGYREAKSLQQPGDYVASPGQVDIYTRKFSHPSGEYDAQPIRITYRSASIDSVVSLRDSRPLDKAALEPELLTSILSDQLENRRPVTLDQVPQHLQDAVIVTEDIRFWHHPGVDPIGMFRAVFWNMRAGEGTERASALTQH